MSPILSYFRLSPTRLGAFALLVPFAVIAAEAPPPPPGVSFGTMMQTFAGLALVLGLFLGAAWLLRRVNGGKSFMSGSGPLRIISSLPIGPRERIVLVEIEDVWLVVGIAPGQMRTLHTLPKGSLPPDEAGEGQFGHWLRQFREQRNDQNK